LEFPPELDSVHRTTAQVDWLAVNNPLTITWACNESNAEVSQQTMWGEGSPGLPHRRRYGDPGFVITLSASGMADLHNYQDHSPSYNGNGQLIGTWQPDGPGFSSFNTLDPNGTWTLFLADISSGSQSRIDTWGLEIEVVPEPVNVALAIFGMAFALVIARRRCPGRAPQA
jgi:hypothetical protein